ncbi:MAG: hypothetical protein H6655_08635 [Ardenticatenaceae bacterium]|nr:hypothetical protein [Ardenticatenaceae bacterium]
MNFSRVDVGEPFGTVWLGGLGFKRERTAAGGRIPAVGVADRLADVVEVGLET